MEQKSLFLTYIFWLLGGMFGLHLFYLNRDYHALVCWMFLGGYFGAGWFRDLWKIPEYVKDANEDPSYMSQLAAKMMREEKPSTGTVRYFGMLLVADTFGYLVTGAIPKELVSNYCLKLLSAVFAPLASALGVYLVGNIGRHEGKLRPAVIAAYFTSPLYFFIESPIFLSSLMALYVFNSYCKQWRRTPRPKKSLFRRVMFFVFCGSLYLLLWSSWLYFNCKLTYQNEEEIKCRDAAKHFFKSPIWKEFVTVVKEIWKTFLFYGWREVWEQLVGAFDPTGEVNALKVLGLNRNATQQEITSTYRKLSREWHPDKHKDLDSKMHAQEKFIEIQQAYEILSHIKSQRIVQNIKNPAESTVDHSEL